MTIRQIPIAMTYTIGPAENLPTDINSLADRKLHIPFIGQRKTIGLTFQTFADLNSYTDEAIAIGQTNTIGPARNRFADTFNHADAAFASYLPSV